MSLKISIFAHFQRGVSGRGGGRRVVISIQMSSYKAERLVRFWNFVKIPAGSNVTAKFISRVDPDIFSASAISNTENLKTWENGGSTGLTNLVVAFDPAGIFTKFQNLTSLSHLYLYICIEITPRLPPPRPGTPL